MHVHEAAEAGRRPLRYKGKADLGAAPPSYKKNTLHKTGSRCWSMGRGRRARHGVTNSQQLVVCGARPPARGLGIAVHDDGSHCRPRNVPSPGAAVGVLRQLTTATMQRALGRRLLRCPLLFRARNAANSAGRRMRCSLLSRFPRLVVSWLVSESRQRNKAPADLRLVPSRIKPLCARYLRLEG
jgi:hypothetical protein